MSSDLSIRIKINSDTKALEITQDGFEKIRQKAESVSDPISKLTNRLASMGHAAVGSYLISEGFDKIVGSGIRLNSQFEQMKLGIASLIAVNSSNVTSLGHTVSAVEKFQIAQAKATESVELLRKANVQTPATLAQITEGYQAALGPALRLGLTSQQTVEYVKLMTMAAAAMGAPMEQIAQESRALLSGEIDMNAQVARNLQITNEQIKVHTKQGDLYEFLTKKLGDFAAGGDAMSKSWAGISSNIVDSVETIKKKATEGIFEGIKADGIDLQTKLTENTDSIAKAFETAFNDIYIISKPAAENIYLAFDISLQSINAGLNVFTEMFNGTIDSMNDKYRELGFFDYLSLGFVVAIEGMRQLASAGLSAITFLGSIFNKFQSIALDAIAGVMGAIGKFSDLVGGNGSDFLQAQVFWAGKANKIKQDGLLIDNTQKAILGDMAKGVDRLASSYNKLALKKNTALPKGNGESLNPNAGGNSANDKKNKAEERAAEKKRKEAERLAQKEYDQEVKRLDLQQSATLDYYKTIGDASSVYVIEESDKLQKLASAGILSNEQMIDVWLKDNEEFAWKNSELERETDKKILEKHIKTIEDKRSALLDYYTKIGDISSAFEISEANKLQKLAESGVYTNEQMLAIWSKDNETYQKEQFEKNNKFWFNLFDGIEKGMDNQIFDAMTNKWTSWGDWFKDFWSSLSTSVARSLSSMLSTSITGSLKEMLLGSVDSGGAQNIFKTYGGFGGALGFSAPAALAGSNTDAAGFTTTTGGTVFDAAGQITKSGSDAESVLSALSNTSSIKTAYGLFTNGIEATVAPYIEQFGSFMQASQFNVGGTSLSGGGALLGGIGGYAIGSLGDKLFGADTKAGSYGAIGGAIGGMFGPVGFAIGAGLGSIIGGMFGSKKSDGVTIFGTATSDYADGTFDSKKKSWFKTKEYHDAFDAKSREQIQSTIGAYDYLLTQMGEIDKTLAISGGKFASIQDFLDRGVAQTFIDTITTADTTEMYNAWSDYAKSINTTIQSALSDSINTYIGDTRNFQTWTLERSGNSLEALKLKSEWATADTDNLQKMLGLDGVTVDNYLIKYKEAINNSFDPQTLQNYKTLGEQLMNNAEAADAYTNALKEQAAVSAKMRPSDMMLSRVSDTTSVTGQSDGTVTKELLNAFNQLIRAIDKQNTLTQLAAGRV